MRVLAALGLSLALATGAGAEEWYEAYRNGVKALAQGQAQRAVPLIEFAASQRPQPGRDVLTYGTNVERQYYPYLRLTEAYLQMKDLAGARSALRRSERWAIEPAEERRRLAAQVEELAARLAPPPPTPAPAPAETVPTTTLPAPPPTTLAPAPPALAEPPVRGASPSPRAPPSRAATGAATPAPTPVPSATSTAAATAIPPPGPGRTIEIVSQPPGASVYLDDELIGTTDLEWGRLVRSGIAPGPHRIRLALAGHHDLSEEILVGGAERTDFRRRLSPASPLLDARVGLVAGIAVVLLALTAWALRRSSVIAPDGTMARGRIFAPTPAPPRGSTPVVTPGVRRDAEGRDFFGEYRLVELLGRGGMASVFKAEKGRELVALKRPLPAFLEEPEFLERFLREAEIGRTLHHPNIIRILDRGEWAGVPYFTMELVPGETLQALLQRHGAMEPTTAARLVVNVAEALDYAHLKGVVHRDLKPSNVMVLPDGGGKVMDYGIARARRFEGLTTTGSFLGSPEYVAPETIEGRGTEARSDLYSLGVMFYEMLAGRRPFSADAPFAILRKHLTEPPPVLSAARPDVPPELERIVHRLLAKTPEERHASAEDLLVELRDFMNRAA
jgi:hypothetical protein